VAGGFDVAIRELPDLRAVAVAHAGSYMQIGKAFDTLYGWLGERNLLQPGLRSIGMYLDDPTAVAEDRLRSKACVAIDGAVDVAAPVVQVDILGGPYAVLRHAGPYASMKAAYQWLYGDWLLRSGKEGADAPVLEDYFNSPRDTAPAELITDIWLPLREA
jgi:AraC family transcriptional regulator